jgi:glucosamine--fructose-6-phosphate aminotransferase (isomerizing)
VSVPDQQFPHFMLREIYEQPQTLASGIEHYFASGLREETAAEFRLNAAEIAAVRRIRIVASGSSRFAGLYGEYVLERLGGIPVEVDYSSQYCYREPVTEPGELTVLLTQSGTTADTILAQREAKAKGAKTVVICNVRNAPITQEADGVIYTHAGKEVAVAATKSFTGQLLALFALSLYFGELRGVIDTARMRALRGELDRLPANAETALRCRGSAQKAAQHFKSAVAWMILGRDISYPIALETALKLKETSYIYAEGYPTGEVKHGPTALADSHLPVFMIATRQPEEKMSVLRYEKSLAILGELAQRGTPAIATVTEGDTSLNKTCFATFPVPVTSSLLSPILEVIPAQLLAYELAVARGVNVDQPRNLSKSVIVE